MQPYSSLLCKILDSWRAFSLFLTGNANCTSDKEDVFQKCVITFRNKIESKRMWWRIAVIYFYAEKEVNTSKEKSYDT
jgi:hypothetical protein